MSSLPQPAAAARRGTLRSQRTRDTAVTAAALQRRPLPAALLSQGAQQPQHDTAAAAAATPAAALAAAAAVAPVASAPPAVSQSSSSLSAFNYTRTGGHAARLPPRPEAPIQSTAAAPVAPAAQPVDTRVEIRAAIANALTASSAANASAAASSSLAAAASSARVSASRLHMGSLPLPFPRTGAAPVNIVQHLLSRQSCPYPLTSTSFKRATYLHRFARLQLTQCVDSRVTSSSAEDVAVALQQKPSKVSEIVAAHELVFALTALGVCLAYSNDGQFKLLCTLNVIADEVIRSLFYNRVSHSLITVSVYRHDHFTSLRCRSTSLDAIRLGKPELGVSLFTSESLQWPGFVEFDDVNKKILTFSASTSLYKVWDLRDYSLQYQLSDKRIDEVKISPGVMLLIHHKEQQRVPLKLVHIETGEVLLSFSHPLVRNAKVSYIEQFNEKMLIKQKKCPLLLIDVARNQQQVEVPEDRFPTPAAFIFLYENALFLTFNKREICVWNFDGQRVARLEDHFNWFPDCNTSNVYISQEQDVIMSYSLTHKQIASMRNRHIDADHWRKERERTGEIHISHIFTGHSLARIQKLKRKKYPFELLSPTQQREIMQALANRGTHADMKTYAALSVTMSDETEAPATPAPDAQATSAAAASSMEDDAAAASTLSPTSQMAANLREQQRSLQMQLAQTQQSLRDLQNTRAAVAAAAAAADAAAAAAAAAAASASSSSAVAPASASSSSSAAPAASAAAAAPAAASGLSWVDDEDRSEMDDDDPHPAGATADDDELTSDDEEALMHERDPTMPPLPPRVPLPEIRLDTVAFTAAEANKQKQRANDVAASSVEPAATAATTGPHALVLSPAAARAHHLVSLLPIEWRLSSLSDYLAYNAHVRQHNRALRHITAVFYNEDKNEIYTGNKQGRLHVWRQA